jgi:nitrate reductase NapE component
MSTPSQHFVHAQDRTVIAEIEPPTRPRPVARVLDQGSFHGIVVHVMQMIEAVPGAHTSRQKEAVKKSRKSKKLRNFLVLAIQL